MRVTDEMKERAYAAVRSAEPGKWTRKAVIDRALETALADVPERSIDAATVALRHVREEIPEAFLREHDGYIFAAVAGMAARITELEAQLARVRELADKYVGGAGNAIRAILDGEEGASAARARERPANYRDLPASEQWAIDKRLGILDWDGS